MFFEGDRIDAVREMILANDLEGRKKALAKLLPMQKQDFKGILEIMGNLPVTIRTLDPPLHEFLPKTEADDRRTLAQKIGVTGRAHQGQGGQPARVQPHAGLSAAAAWGSSIPRSPRCRPRPSSRPPASCARRARTRIPRS